MFGTLDSNEATLPKALQVEGQKVWRSCELVVHAPWFIVEYVVQFDESIQKSVALIYTNNQLLELYQNPDISITEVHVMTPRSVNETSHWQMHQLRHVMQGTYENDPALTPVTVYVTVDGRKLQYCSRKKRKTNLHNFITIYADFKNQFDLSVISQNA